MAKKNTQFTYKWNGEKITLPRFGDWPFKVRRQLLDAKNDEEQITIALAGCADEDSLPVIDKMHTSDLVDLVVAWQRDAGITLGESESSGES